MQRSVHVLIVAAGRGVRAGGDVPKQYRLLAGRPVLRRAVEAFVAHPGIATVRVVIHADDADACAAATAGLALAPPVVGGATRQASVLAGLEAIAAAGGASHVLVHDAARPLVTAATIDRVLAALADADGATPALPVVDSLRTGGRHVDGEVPRDRLHRVQTPQGFAFAPLLAAHRAADRHATDDVAVARAAGLAVVLVDRKSVV